MKDVNAAFAAHMDRTWPAWRRELNGTMCERVRLAFLAGVDAERKEMETGKCEKQSSAYAKPQDANHGSSNHPKPQLKASGTRKIRRHK